MGINCDNMHAPKYVPEQKNTLDFTCQGLKLWICNFNRT